ncbi:MAG: thiol-disulfide oxidoreductase DCC family protein [Rhodothermia bacterium]|nr:thiol-disulfide oxidoreductase DCC family protein [Rhodothermia bacterium]
MSQTTSGPILLFDGVCNLCNSSVDFIVRHDPDGVVKFASLQSRTGRRLLKMAGLPTDYDASLVLVEGARFSTSSDAALRVARYLTAPWSWAAVFQVVPRIIRDAVYRWVSRNRYNWFGKRDTCRIPTPEERERFIDSDPIPEDEISEAPAV